MCVSCEAVRVKCASGVEVCVGPASCCCPSLVVFSVFHFSFSVSFRCETFFHMCSHFAHYPLFYIFHFFSHVTLFLFFFHFLVVIGLEWQVGMGLAELTVTLSTTVRVHHCGVCAGRGGGVHR